MSSDNGIYILISPIKGLADNYEYRITSAQTIDKLDWKVPVGWDYNPEQLVNYFI